MSTDESENDPSNCLCLYQVPHYSVYQGKAYLGTNGSPLIDKWQALKGKIDCSSGGMVITDNSDAYILFHGQENILFNIEKMAIVSGSPKTPENRDLVSSIEKMTFYAIQGTYVSLYITKYTYSASSVSDIQFCKIHIY